MIFLSISIYFITALGIFEYIANEFIKTRELRSELPKI